MLSYDEVDILSRLNKGVMICDGEGQIIWVNQKFTQVTGYQKDDVVGASPNVLKSGVHSAEFYSNLWHGIRYGQGYSGVIYNKRKNGSVYPEWIDIHRTTDEVEDILFIAIFQELSDSHMAMLYEVNHDHLTGALNRRGLYDWLRNHDTAYGVVFIADLDDFKKINDEYGHDAGDRLLCEVAERLQNTLRHHDAIIRYGGDEFVGLCPYVESQQVIGLMNRIHRAVTQDPMRYDGDHSLKIGMTMGVYHGNFTLDAITKADQLLLEAKKNKKNTYFWKP